ncbi:MAG: ABC transporter substrate-binding protein, partial [Comamonas sp.]
MLLKLLFTSLLSAGLLTVSGAQAETVRWARASDPTTLDPHSFNTGTNFVLSHQMYETLVTRDAKGKLVPTLATSWALTSDPSVWEFKLRKGVKFHDGSLFTADDVLFSLERARSPSSDMRSLLVAITDVVKNNPRYEDAQQRILAATIGGVRVVCAYVPNGQSIESDK